MFDEHKLSWQGYCLGGAELIFYIFNPLYDIKLYFFFFFLQLQLNENNTESLDVVQEKTKSPEHLNSSRTESPTENTSEPSPDLLIKHPLQVTFFQWPRATQRVLQRFRQ